MINRLFKQALTAIFGAGFALSATAASAEVGSAFVDTGTTTLTDQRVIHAGGGLHGDPE